MRLNEDDATVGAMDVLFPRVGEMVGGSQREERTDKLEAKMVKLKETMKALRASQMNKPPPQAMKLNKVRTSTHPQPLTGQRLKELR